MPIEKYLKDRKDRELDFVEVKKTLKSPAQNKKSNPTFSYFGSCPDWDIEASELRAMSNRKKAQW